MAYSLSVAGSDWKTIYVITFATTSIYLLLQIYLLLHFYHFPKYFFNLGMCIPIFPQLLSYQVRNVVSGVDLPDKVEWTKFSCMEWTHDGLGFFYNRLIKYVYIIIRTRTYELSSLISSMS